MNPIELFSQNSLGLGLVILFLALMLIFSAAARRRPELHLRDLPAFQRLSQAIGIAVEAGRRLHVGLGVGEFNHLPAGSALVGLRLLDRVARTASISDQPAIATSGEGTIGLLSQDTIQSAFESIGAAGSYDPSLGQVTGVTPFSYAAGAAQVIHSQQVAVTVLAGHFGSEAALIAEAAEQTGGVSLGGSDSLTAQAVLAVSAQELLLGEELYAAGAYLNAGPLHTASLRAQDFVRWVLIGLILAGAALKFVGMI